MYKVEIGSTRLLVCAADFSVVASVDRPISLGDASKWLGIWGYRVAGDWGLVRGSDGLNLVADAADAP
jgi:hypothetical protein